VFFELMPDVSLQLRVFVKWSSLYRFDRIALRISVLFISFVVVFADLHAQFPEDETEEAL
jgi:hypothetical protein